MNARGLLSLKRGDAPNGALEERLHKVLANAGLGSRRMLEERIANGEVLVNSAPAQTGSSVHAGDRVELDRKQFVVATDTRDNAEVMLYHKPEGELTTRDDPEGRPTVFEHLPALRGSRWIAVGRLDTNTTGLLLLTTDGELANALMHPSREIEREYLCRVHGEVPDETLELLKAGVQLEDGPARFDEVHIVNRGGSHSWFRVVLREGRNREVRRLWDSQGFLVSRLKRIRYGNVELPRGLRPGQHEALPADGVNALRELSGAGAPQPTLTLKPVLHQRSTGRRAVTEVRPTEQAPKAWTGAHHGEARELTAFDRVRPDDFAPGRGKRRRGPPGREVNGNVARPERTQQRKSRGGKRGVAPGQELPSVRTWFAGETRNDAARPARGRPQPGGDGRPRTSGGPGKPRVPGGGTGRPRGPGGAGNRGPGAGRGRGPNNGGDRRPPRG
ncbi:MAG TPA: pseudouridine synthase [Rhodanobacteraceae bacterium]|nr:pseudouridine synthase [Rhodanobacteraceae bacterium]